MAKQNSMQSLYHNFFIYYSFNQHLGCFHLFITVDCDAVNMGLQFTFSYTYLISFAYISRIGLARSFDNSVLTLSIMTSRVAILAYIIFCNVFRAEIQVQSWLWVYLSCCLPFALWMWPEKLLSCVVQRTGHSFRRDILEVFPHNNMELKELYFIREEITNTLKTHDPKRSSQNMKAIGQKRGNSQDFHYQILGPKFKPCYAWSWSCLTLAKK